MQRVAQSQTGQGEFEVAVESLGLEWWRRMVRLSIMDTGVFDFVGFDRIRIFRADVVDEGG